MCSAATHGRLPLRDRQRAIVLAAVKDKPFGWPRKARPSLTATRHDGAVELRSGRKNGSGGVKQKNGCESRFRAKILSSRYARAAINFPGTKNRNNRGFPHQIPWWCSLAVKKIKHKYEFSKEGAKELAAFHKLIMDNLKLAFSVFINENVKIARLSAKRRKFVWPSSPVRTIMWRGYAKGDRKA